MWVPIVLAAVIVGLFGVPRREFFKDVKDPSTLTDEEVEALLETEEGRTYKSELITTLRRQGVPEIGIPEVITKTLKELLIQRWRMYSLLTDKTDLEGRFEQMFMTPQSITLNGKPLQEATAELVKMYYDVGGSETTCNTEVQGQIKEITKKAGPPTGISSLNILFQSVKDEKVRKMLQTYAEHIITYYTTGNPVYKTAAERSLEAVQSHINDLEKKVEEETARATGIVNGYDAGTQDVTELRKQLQSIQKDGPKLQDQYETQKRINETQPLMETKYWVKIGIVVGLFAIAVVARSFVRGDTPPNYVVKSGLIIGLVGVGFAAYKFLLG